MGATRLLRFLASGTQSDLNLTQFWNSLHQLGTPLLAEDTDPNRTRVTLVFQEPQLFPEPRAGQRGSEASAPASQPLTGVYARLNRVTDKAQVSAGLMSHHRGTDIWSLTLSLPSALRCSYQLVPLPAGTPESVIAQLGRRGAALPGIPDPLNPHTITTASTASVLQLPAAPPQPEWSQASGAADGVSVGRLRQVERVVAGQMRPVWLRQPAAGRRAAALLVLLDAEVWFGGLDVNRALSLAELSGRIVPTAVLGVGNLNSADRVAILGGRYQTVQDLREIVQAFRASGELPQLAASATAICGQSLGGITALLAAAVAPEIFGTVLAHSPSMWWRPGVSSPQDLADDRTPWIQQALAEITRPTVNLRIDVGDREGSMAARAQLLQQRLTATAWQVSTNTYAGGHDFACWRGALITGLAELSARI